MKDMKVIFVLGVIFLMNFSFLYGAESYNKFRVFDNKSGMRVGLDGLLNGCCGYDVLFVGEKHDDKDTHFIEYMIFKGLSEKCGRWNLSMEMFERDVQEVVNRYMMGSIDEKEFFNKSRPWPNYISDYRRIVEYAKRKRVDLIAANIPRRIASLVAKKGWDYVRENLKGEEGFFADKLYSPKNRYYRKFKRVMESMGGHSKMRMGKMVWNMYRAQCIKDNTMAESIYRYIKSHPDESIVHYNGKFHSDYFLGTVERLKRYDKGLKIGVVSIIPISGKLPSRLRRSDRKIGNYTIYCQD